MFVKKLIDNLYGQGSMDICKTKMLIYNAINTIEVALRHIDLSECQH